MKDKFVQLFIKKKVIIWVILAVLVEVFFAVKSYKEIGGGPLREQHISLGELQQMPYAGSYWDKDYLCILDEDPILFLDNVCGIVREITINTKMIQGIERIACYYDSGEGYYSEINKRSVNVSGNSSTLVLNRNVKQLRIDFEGISKSAKVQMSEVIIKYSKNGMIYFIYSIFLTAIFIIILSFENLNVSKVWQNIVLKTFVFVMLQYFLYRAMLVIYGAMIVFIMIIMLLFTVLIGIMEFGRDTDADHKTQ